MENKTTLGSLFDGSGGFQLGAVLNGITPVWASEIEPFPIRVTTKRFPDMKHYGDICKIDGSKIEPVDIITFGSPCQDLSLAGKRHGLGGDKSNLFHEAIRIIKEMRCATNGRYPRFIVWENVPGAYSSAKGEDFRCVLEKIVKIKDETLSVPMPEKDKWLHAGEITGGSSCLGDDFSVAWRTLDAQFWGVPQRRRRIYLVADFAGGSAGKILFESEGLLRDTAQSGKQGEGITTYAQTSTCPTISLEPGALIRLGKKCEIEKTSTLRAQMGDNQTCVAVMGERQQGLPISENTAHTLLGSDYKGTQCVFENHSQDTRYIGPLEKAQTVSATYGMGGNNQPFVVKKTPTVYGICSDGSNSMKSDNPSSGIYEAETSRTIDANGGNPGCNQGGIAVVESKKGFSFDPYNSKQDKVMPSIGKNCGMSTGRSICLQGSMIGRKDKNGPNGSGINENVSFCLNCTDKHGVVYAIDRETFNCGQNFARNLGITDNGVTSTLNAQGPSAVASFYPQMKAESQCYREDDISNTLVNGTNPGYQNGVVEPTYSVRRLTPLECCRLQGFPDFWCQNLETDNPTDEDITFWKDVFETHRVIMGTSSKPKSKMQIVKWLTNPYSDSAEYSMWGNGVALPCVVYVLRGIIEQVKSTQ